MRQIQQQLFSIGQIETPKHQNRKNHNQYFTPEFVVEKAFSLISNSEVENVIDPAVGDGAFLRFAGKKWKNAKLFGIDVDKKIIDKLKNSDLPNAIFFSGDALRQETWQNYEIQKILSNGRFSLVVGNPPFSSWFSRVTSSQILSNYKLARKNGKLARSQAIEILFLEMFINLCQDNGFVIIVFPDGILSNPKHKYVRNFILHETKVKHIINLPRHVFDDTSAKTSILILQKKRKLSLDYQTSISNLEKHVLSEAEGSGKISDTIEVKADELIDRMDYHYYHSLDKSRLKELMRQGVEFNPLKNFIASCKTGKTLYGKERKFSKEGLRFLHATNITDIGINYRKDEKFIDAFSKMNSPKAHAKVGDILFVRVGAGCAGRTAIVDSKKDEGVATDYIHLLRVKNIDPYFLVLYLKTKYGKDSIELLKHGVGTVSINQSDLRSIPIPTVSKQIQDQVRIRYKELLEKWHEAIYSDQIQIAYGSENEMRALITDLEIILEEYGSEK